MRDKYDALEQEINELLGNHDSYVADKVAGAQSRLDAVIKDYGQYDEASRWDFISDDPEVIKYSSQLKELDQRQKTMVEKVKK